MRCADGVVFCNSVRVFEIGPGGSSQGKAEFKHEGPVLDLCWSKDGSKIISAGADNAARMYDVQSGTTTQIAGHEQPVRYVRWIEVNGQSVVATGSWDKVRQSISWLLSKS